MADTPADDFQVEGYHAHVYYNAATRAAARHDRLQIRRRIRPLSDEPIGPHPASQFTVIFKSQHVVPWLMLNREGLNVLVHPLTHGSYDDHSKNALWLGAPVPLKLDTLAADYRAELLPKG